MRVSNKRRRCGATVVEFAVVCAAVLVLIFGTAIGGTGVFRYQEMAHLAREGARYASTHGGNYSGDGIAIKTGVAAVVSKTELEAYLKPKAVAMNVKNLVIDVSWSSPTTITPRNIPSYLDTDATLIPPAQKEIQNYVTVTVTYQWLPEIFVAGPITLTSKSTMAVSY